jgi:hypothetical protein
MAEPRFAMKEEITRKYRRFNAVGTQLTVLFLPPTEGVDSNLMSHFLASVSDLFEHALKTVTIPIWLELQLAMKKTYRTNL